MVFLRCVLCYHSYAGCSKRVLWSFVALWNSKGKAKGSKMLLGSQDLLAVSPHPCCSFRARRPGSHRSPQLSRECASFPDLCFLESQKMPTSTQATKISGGEENWHSTPSYRQIGTLQDQCLHLLSSVLLALSMKDNPQYEQRTRVINLYLLQLMHLCFTLLCSSTQSLETSVSSEALARATRHPLYSFASSFSQRY